MIHGELRRHAAAVDRIVADLDPLLPARRPWLGAEWRRPAELVATHADLRVGAAYATMSALVKRLNVSEVATLDRRHFVVVRARHVPVLLRFSSRDGRCGTTPSATEDAASPW